MRPKPGASRGRPTDAGHKNQSTRAFRTVQGPLGDDPGDRGAMQARKCGPEPEAEADPCPAPSERGRVSMVLVRGLVVVVTRPAVVHLLVAALCV